MLHLWGGIVLPLRWYRGNASVEACSRPFLIGNEEPGIMRLSKLEAVGSTGAVPYPVVMNFKAPTTVRPFLTSFSNSRRERQAPLKSEVPTCFGGPTSARELPDMKAGALPFERTPAIS